MNTRRVVITGMGIVSPLGVGVQYNWDAITAGRSGIKPITHFEASDLPSRIAGTVPRAETENDPLHLYHPARAVDHKEQKRNDIFIQYAMQAAKDAVEDSGFVADTEEKKCRAGVMIGSGIGGLGEIHDTTLVINEKGPRRVSPFFIPGSLINLASGQVSIAYGFKGPNHSVVTACATGAHAIGDAARMIMLDDADVMVAGGAEAAVNRIGVAGFAACRALSTSYNDRPEEASRPFDKGRDGFVIGEGSGIVVLEEYEHAKKRGAQIYAEIVGYGMSGDAYHITSPAEDGNGGYRAMEAALKRAGLSTADIDYINAHGTSTPVGDAIEVSAVKRLFGANMKDIAMSSTKSSIGHLLGAAGAVEAIYSAMAIKTGVLPPTLNLHDPDPAAEGVNLVPLIAQEKKLRAIMSNSFGFGGTNASLIFKAV